MRKKDAFVANKANTHLTKVLLPFLRSLKVCHSDVLPWVRRSIGNFTPAGWVVLTVLNSRHSRSGKKMKMLTMMARRRSTSRRSTDIPLLMYRSISPRGPIPHKSWTSSKTHIALQKQNKTSKTRYFKQKGPWQLNGAKANLK